ncbi:helix-turn-helix transcriptional regulator [Cyanothece sp. BG0011]|uniref:helix-turn-helix transcriptional regulator n=1 Tax=Cyanothece sp. BG0011 TaxID=2082950 RepID=UPI000D1E25C8|nr:AraC family transcriptional regulator [Cyanothece sp. BG0011]
MRSNPSFDLINSQTQERFSEPSSLTQCLINQVTEAIFCVDCQTRFQYVNDAACALIGCSREHLLQTTINDIEIDFFSQTWSEYWALIQEKSSVNFQTELSTDTETQVLDVTINFLEYDSEVYGCILVRPLAKVSPQPLLRVVPNHQQSCQKQTSFYPNCTQLKPIFEFIENHYTQPISLNDVAEAVGYSPAYLTNLVKRRTRKTIINWILERRMLEARSLLLNTQDSITKIAMSIGFSDAYYFSRRFSQLHEISPKRWRQQHQMQSA